MGFINKFISRRHHLVTICNYVNLCHYVNISWFFVIYFSVPDIGPLVTRYLFSMRDTTPTCQKDTAIGTVGLSRMQTCFHLLPFEQPSSPAVPEFRSCSKDGCIEICLFQQRQEAANWKLCFLMWWFWWWFLNGEEHSIDRNSLSFRESGVQQEAAR